MSTTRHYVQPIACHEDHPERLLFLDVEGQAYLWHGDGREPELIPAPLAAWLCSRLEMCYLPDPHLWFDIESLPLVATTV